MAWRGSIEPLEPVNGAPLLGTIAPYHVRTRFYRSRADPAVLPAPSALPRPSSRGCGACTKRQASRKGHIRHPRQACARALEQALFEAMVGCLASGEPAGVPRTHLHHRAVMHRLEETLQANPGEALYMADLSKAVGASYPTLRVCCQEYLGMSPKLYLWLRRMHLTTRALRMTDPEVTTVTEIATNYGFCELGRFSVAYRALFGESPWTSLHRQSADPKPDETTGLLSEFMKTAYCPVILRSTVSGFSVGIMRPRTTQEKDAGQGHAHFPRPRSLGRGSAPDTDRSPDRVRRRVQGSTDLGRTALYAAAALRGRPPAHRLSIATAEACLHKFCSEFRPTAGVAWRGTAGWGNHVPQPGRAARPVEPGAIDVGLIAIDPVQLETYGLALSGKALAPPAEGRVLRPSQRNTARLRRLHAQACRLAETRSSILAHPQVARAVEDEPIHALVICLTARRVREHGVTKHRHIIVMIRFEEVLAEISTGRCNAGIVRASRGELPKISVVLRPNLWASACADM